MYVYIYIYIYICIYVICEYVLARVFKALCCLCDARVSACVRCQAFCRKLKSLLLAPTRLARREIDARRRLHGAIV